MRGYRSIRIGKDKISLLLDTNTFLKLVFLIMITLAIFIISMSLGQVKVHPYTVVSSLFGGGSELEQLVIYQFRLPRTIAAMLVGMGLAVAGGILQGMIRNHLAAPDTIGVTAGAGMAVVAFLWFFSDERYSLIVSIKWLPVAAFVGASIVAFAVYFLSWKEGVTPIRLVLIGIGIAALMQAGTTMFMVLGPIHMASQANIWITGSLNSVTWEDVNVLLPFTVILIILAFISSRNVNVQALGEDIATGVGSPVQRHRFILLMISTGLVGTAVAVAGGIGFVGLMAPHMARKLVGSSFGSLLPVSAFIGATLVMLADLVGRTLFLPSIVPAGVFTAAIGAPYFIYLLMKTKNS
ncbi:iron ABC transporter permease [Salipaludibacillus agaradhaerens]|uniref:Iron ABC transporter permease n=1 Tax=Salipaludibacillus agaradhaerens TaxID=76935 RepID=A0A9Q4FZH9_SALAG|nr:iron ABC transporter permease [Salipaludibacillus agaradhaerens]MCR6098820.1 iron ABC transporter permease [Salipaludibacillus agaradhaerens]MCR6115827.1 iron ABC transporter permease [Salipaludibacillus agaradhaerens]